jgi:antitoxin component YwqK of YwqJK toxin-antitoxin module
MAAAAAVAEPAAAEPAAAEPAAAEPVVQKISSLITGGSNAPPLPADAEAICCLCHEGDSAEMPLLQIPVCNCKGSMRFHHSCVLEMSAHNPNCGACGKVLANPDIAPLLYNENDPEIAGAVGPEQYYDNMQVRGYTHTFHHKDEKGLTHGICKVFYEHFSNGYGYTKTNIPWTILEVSHYDHGKRHGPYKRWSAHENSVMQYPHVEVTFDQGAIRGPFKFYDNYKKGRLWRAGTVHSTKATGPLRFMSAFEANTLYIGEFMEDSGEGYGITTHCTFRKPAYDTIVNAIREKDLAALADKLADGEHIIPYSTRTKYLTTINEIDGRITFSVRDGKVEGAWVATLFSGEVAEQRMYKDGKLHGPYKRMFYDYMMARYGQPALQGVEMEGSFSNGRRHGKFTYNHLVKLALDGPMRRKKVSHEVRPRLVVNYRGGMRVGQQTLYDDKGLLMETTTLTDDGTQYLHGPAAFYQEGMLVQRCNFYLDELHGKLTFYSAHSLPWLQVTMDKGKLRGGSWINRYDETGALDKYSCERVKPDGDFLLSVKEIDNSTVRCAAYTAGDIADNAFVEAAYVEVEPEPEPEPLSYLSKTLGDHCFCGMCNDKDYYGGDSYDEDDYYDSEEERERARDYYNSRRSWSRRY